MAKSNKATGPALVSIPGGRGRPRLPTRTKELRGTADKGRNKNPLEPKPPAFEIPPAPETATEDEKTSWNELRTMINLLPGVAAAPDMATFVQMVHVHVVSQLAYRELVADGVVCHGEKMDRPHPAAGTHSTHVQLFARLAAQWGIAGAAGRSRVSGSPAGAGDGLSEFGPAE